MTENTFNIILSSFNALKNVRKKYERDWRDIAKWISPRGISFDVDTEPAYRKLPGRDKLYDETIKSYSDSFAKGLKSYTCSSQSPFFSLTPVDPQNASDDNTRYIFQQRALQIRHMLASTRFYKTTKTFFHNYGDFGTGVMLLDYNPDSRKFLFRTLAVGDCYLMRNRYTDEIDTLFHVSWMTRLEAIESFGEEKLSSQLWNNKDDFTKCYRFIELYCRREAFGLNKEEGFPETEWLEMAWEDGQNRPCYQSGTDDKRFAAITFDEAPDGDAYGTSYPGESVITTARNLQRMMKSQLDASQLMTNPPIKKTAGFVADIKPGGFVDVPAGQDIAPLQLAQDVSWTNEMRAQLQAIAKQVYYVDFFLMLSQYQGNVNTATLAQGLQNEQVRMMSDFLDSLLDEFFSPLILWMHGVMLREGLFAGEAAEEVGEDVEIKMTSTLYQLQRQLELQPTQTAMSMLLPYVQIAPDQLLPYIDFQAYAEAVRDKTDADIRIIRSSEDVQQMQRASAEAKAAALREEQKVAQQDSNARMIQALSGAARDQNQAAAGAEGGGAVPQTSGDGSRYADLRLRR